MSMVTFLLGLFSAVSCVCGLLIRSVKNGIAVAVIINLTFAVGLLTSLVLAGHGPRFAGTLFLFLTALIVPVLMVSLLNKLRTQK